jgi:hypothetical protein
VRSGNRFLFVQIAPLAIKNMRITLALNEALLYPGCRVQGLVPGRAAQSHNRSRAHQLRDGCCAVKVLDNKVEAVPGIRFTSPILRLDVPALPSILLLQCDEDDLTRE